MSRDLRQPWTANDGVQSVWATIYRDPSAHWQAYELAEKLVDFEVALIQQEAEIGALRERVVQFSQKFSFPS